METVQKPLFVISDAHLGADVGAREQAKSDRLHCFWQEVESRQGDLVILGDLFDFWFEYRYAIPRQHFDHLVAIKRLVNSGCRVWYVAGNHDFWIGPFMEEQLGITFCTDELDLNCNGTHVTFAHGDGWPPSEHAYRMLKRLLRSRWAIALFRMLSPDIGYPLAGWVSGSSHGKHKLNKSIVNVYSKIAQDRLSSSTNILVTAHLHAMVHEIWPVGEWLVTGDWIHHFSFVKIDENGPKLLQWNDNGDHRQVKPQHVLSSTGVD
jgi:UDP-2,3-diacylglucosamine hydrolase